MKNPVNKPKWWDEFIAFAVKGNAMALAVGTIIGAAFSTITKSLTDDIIMPIVAIFMGGIDFSEHFPYFSLESAYIIWSFAIRTHLFIGFDWCAAIHAVCHILYPPPIIAKIGILVRFRVFRV